MQFPWNSFKVRISWCYISFLLKHFDFSPYLHIQKTETVSFQDCACETMRKFPLYSLDFWLILYLTVGVSIEVELITVSLWNIILFRIIRLRVLVTLDYFKHLKQSVTCSYPKRALLTFRKLGLFYTTINNRHSQKLTWSEY